MRAPQGRQWADDYTFPDADKYVRWCPAEFYRTHQSVWRYAAYIDAGHPSRNWSHRGFTHRTVWWRAARAERRSGMRVRWRVFLPSGAFDEFDPADAPVRPEGLPAPHPSMYDTVILPMEAASDDD